VDQGVSNIIESPFLLRLIRCNPGAMPVIKGGKYAHKEQKPSGFVY